MNAYKRLVLVGASGHGKVCAEIAKLSEKYSEILFLDDDSLVKKCGKYDVKGSSNDFAKYINEQTEFFVSIGNHEHRRRIQEKIESAGGTITILIHPNAFISEDSTIGKGSAVMAGAVINTGTQIGNGVIINTLSSIDHDCTVGDWCHIAVGAHVCGTVSVGNNCWIGAGAVVKNNMIICDDVEIGAGAVVVKTIDELGLYVGVPAKKK